MQTFLPYPDFSLSAQCLDYRRLGKQRVECKQILIALLGNKGWVNHPATKMWAGYELALSEYYNTIVSEWVNRGYKNSMPLIDTSGCTIEQPPWLGNSDFHRAHQSNLLRKNPEFYGKYRWEVPSNLPYIWPIEA